jgi:carbonic anhydrase
MSIYGWIYDIESGEVLAYNPETDEFEVPQTLLASAPSEHFVHTDAPPIPSAYQSVAPQPVKTKNPGDLAGWMSPEQADRIYRGSAANR